MMYPQVFGVAGECVTLERWTVVGFDFFWYSMSGEDTVEFRDNCVGRC